MYGCYIPGLAIVLASSLSLLLGHLMDCVHRLIPLLYDLLENTELIFIPLIQSTF